MTEEEKELRRWRYEYRKLHEEYNNFQMWAGYGLLLAVAWLAGQLLDYLF